MRFTEYMNTNVALIRTIEEAELAVVDALKTLTGEFSYTHVVCETAKELKEWAESFQPYVLNETQKMAVETILQDSQKCAEAVVQKYLLV